MKQISLNQIEKRFGSRTVLRDISLELGPSQTLGVMGASGCGKSTLIRVLAALEEPTAGSVHWGEIDVATMKSKALRQQRARVQIVFQDSASALSPRRTIGQSLAEPLRTHPLPTHKLKSRGEIESDIEQWMTRVGLNLDYKARYPHQLSGGERQRVALIRSLILKPQFLLADEPVSALDVVSKVEVLELLVELQSELGFSLLLASHDKRVINRLTSQHIELGGG